MELTINNLVKIIIGIFVVVVVVLGIYFIFKEKIIDFFQNIPSGEPAEFFRVLLK
ncbi:hypothetical protein ACFLZJ_00085 [Nanoarchaeota archaeon]